MKRLQRILWVALACASLAPVAALPLQAQQTPRAVNDGLSPLRTQLERAEDSMLDDPRAVVAIATRVQAAARRLPQGKARDRLLARAYWLHGEASGRLGDLAAAEVALAEAIKLIEAGGPRGPLHARVKMSLGSTAFDKGEVQKAFTNFRDAFAIFVKLDDTRGQALALQSMGLIYIDAGDYQRALKYYTQSAEVHPADRPLAMSALNNQALAFKEMGRLDPAEKNYRAALQIARELKSVDNEVRILANIAGVQLAGGQLAAAARTADRAMALGAGKASVSLALAWAVRAQIAWAKRDAAGTIRLLPEVFGTTPLTETSFEFRDVHQAASDAYLALGNSAEALAHLRAVNRLDAEAREIRSSANAALMAAQFDYSNQELRIAKRDVALANSRARTQWLMLGASLLLLAASLIAFFWIRRSRNETRAVNVQLNRALAAKSEFLATTSHEIRTPLNGIMGMTQVLLHTPGVEPAVQERIALIDGAGKAMKAIVDDLLDMAKIEAGEISIERGEVDLPQLIEETVRLWSGEAEAKGIEIVAELSEAPSRIVEDERKLRQILFNLTSNAVKFTEAGQVAVSAKTDGDRLIIAVRDSGIGIPADQQAAIFEAFHQVDGATTRQHSGTGLGLSISSKLATSLGGRIKVESEPDSGSTFTLELPLVLASRPDAPTASSQSVGLADAKVLLLDRNPLFQSLVAAALDGSIGSFDIADSFADALGKGPVDILLLDQATIGEAPLDILADALGSPVMLRLIAPGETPASNAELAKAIPPLNLAPALEALLDARAPRQLAA